jgi:hypothetical protein
VIATETGDEGIDGELVDRDGARREALAFQVEDELALSLGK